MKRAVIKSLCVLSLLLVCIPQAAFPIDKVDAESSNVRQLVSDWAAAWSTGSFNDYTAYYIDGFKGDFSSNAAWREHRRGRVDGRRDISVHIGSVLVRFNIDDPEKAQAVFVQSYKSSSWCDVVEKTLDLQRTEFGWRISNEQSQTRSSC
ncbi:MAG: hypothetical protein OES99_08295 [Gammaproteobacteria bacterium]|nr:hypothetical protein [Gammaproteobacteria bacterium]